MPKKKPTNPLPRGVEKITDVIQHPQEALNEIHQLRSQLYKIARELPPSKVIVSGSRSITSYAVVKECIETGLKKLRLPKPTLIIEGEAGGVDLLAKQWAIENKVPVDPNPANWNAFDKAAGGIRNREQAMKGEALIAIWDGISTGTANQIAWVAVYGLPIYVAVIEKILPTKEKPIAKPVETLCGKQAPASKACRLGPHCICVQAAGHTTPHRARCGSRWANRKRGK